MAEEKNGKAGKDGGTDENPADDASAGRQNGVNKDAPVPEPSKNPAAGDSGDKTIDIDLTKLSGTMVYSEVYNMPASPEEYIGKTVKMNGAFAYYYDEAADIYYFACIIADATACCSQGIEFVLTDEYTYPDDYPLPGEEEGNSLKTPGQRV